MFSLERKASMNQLAATSQGHLFIFTDGKELRKGDIADKRFPCTQVELGAIISFIPHTFSLNGVIHLPRLI